MKSHRQIYIAVFIILCSVCVFAVEHDVEDIIAKQDELYRSSSSYSVMEMQIVTPHWERTLELEAWSEGMDKTFIVINSPKKEKGTATLRIDNEMWNYLPKTDKIMKIPPSMMMSSWMGSDFTNDDLVKETTLEKDYDYKIIEPGDAVEGEVYVELIPKEDAPSVWGKIIFAVREGDYLPLWEKFYDEKGNLKRVMNFKDIRNIGGREIPTVMELLPQDEEKQSTIIKYIDVQFGIEFGDEVFSLRNLQKKR
ncbi:outer membrane lipoprotein-sorting protein [bacterium]|nr:outer membrane lipoprotein-sorting protein [bacterium]